MGTVTQKLTTLVLKPVIYSKAQTVEKIAKKLQQDPKQVCNSEAAFKGLVMEFIMAEGPDYGQPVGTLDEYYTHTKATVFYIHDRKGGKIVITRTNDGNFAVSKLISPRK